MCTVLHASIDYDWTMVKPCTSIDYDWTLEEGQFDTAIIHVVINILFNNNNTGTEVLLQNISCRWQPDAKCMVSARSLFHVFLLYAKF